MFLFLLVAGFFIAIISAPVRFVIFLNRFFNDSASEIAESIFLRIISDISCLILLPLTYVSIGGFSENEVSNGSGIYYWIVWIIVCIAAYFIAIYQAEISSFLREFCLNLLLGAGIAVNFFIGYDLIYGLSDGFWATALGNGPIILLFLIALVKRQILFARRLPKANDSLRQTHANVLDYMLAETNNLLLFDNLNPAEDAAARVLASPLYVRLGVFVVGGFLTVSSGLLLANLLGYDWF